MTILLWPQRHGWLASWWEPNRSAPYDVKFGFSVAEAIGRLDLKAGGA